MAKLTVEEFLNRIKDRTKDKTDDETLQFIEDATDTLNGLTENKDDTDWKAKYEENDKQWRQKYKDRFFSTGDSVEENNNAEDETEDETEDNEEIVTNDFNDLFK